MKIITALLVGIVAIGSIMYPSTMKGSRVRVPQRGFQKKETL